jgi:hypothetical protein
MHLERAQTRSAPPLGCCCCVCTRYDVTPRYVLPLPTALPDFAKPRPAECEYERDSDVLALYPQTTCFYVGRVVAVPSKVRAACAHACGDRCMRL